jgi:hypothetical protein
VIEIAPIVASTVATLNKITNKKRHKFRATWNYYFKIGHIMSRCFAVLKHTLQGRHDGMEVATKDSNNNITEVAHKVVKFDKKNLPIVPNKITMMTRFKKMKKQRTNTFCNFYKKMWTFNCKVLLTLETCAAKRIWCK